MIFSNVMLHDATNMGLLSFFQYLKTGNIILDVCLATAFTVFMNWCFQQDWKTILCKKGSSYHFKRTISKNFNMTERHSTGSELLFDVFMEYIEDHMQHVSTSETNLFFNHETDVNREIDRCDAAYLKLKEFPSKTFVIDNINVALVSKTLSNKEMKKMKQAKPENNEDEEEAPPDEASSSVPTNEKIQELVLEYNDTEDYHRLEQKVIQFFRQKYDHEDKSKIRFQYSFQQWRGDIGHKSYLVKIPNRPFHEITLEQSRLTPLKALCNHFKQKTGPYTDSSNPYCLTLLFSGPPGNGKTAAIQSLIQYFNIKNVRVINSVSVLRRAVDIRDLLFEDTNELEMILFEEIDAGDKKKLLESRLKKEERRKKKEDASSLKKMIALNNVDDDYHTKCEWTLSDWLDAFNGLIGIQNRIIIMSTNHLDYLDPAIYRRKRVHSVVHFKNITMETLRQFIHIHWPGEVIEDKDLLFIKNYPHTYHALLWDCKDLYHGSTAQEFLTFVQDEIKKDTSMDYVVPKGEEEEEKSDDKIYTEVIWCKNEVELVHSDKLSNFEFTPPYLLLKDDEVKNKDNMLERLKEEIHLSDTCYNVLSVYLDEAIKMESNMIVFEFSIRKSLIYLSTLKVLDVQEEKTDEKDEVKNKNKPKFTNVIGSRDIEEITAADMEEVVHFYPRSELDQNDLQNIDQWMKDIRDRFFAIDEKCASDLLSFVGDAYERGANFAVMETHYETQTFKVILYKITGAVEFYGNSDDDEEKEKGEVIPKPKRIFTTVIGSRDIIEIDAKEIDQMQQFYPRLALDQNDLQNVDKWMKRMHDHFTIDDMCETDLLSYVGNAYERGVNYVVIEMYLEEKAFRVLLYKIISDGTFYDHSDDENDNSH